MSSLNLICSYPSGDWLFVWYLHACCMYFVPTELQHKIFLQISLSLLGSLCSWLVRHSITPLASHTGMSEREYTCESVSVCVCCVKWHVCQNLAHTFESWVFRMPCNLQKSCFPVNHDFLAIYAFTPVALDKNLTHCSGQTLVMELFSAKWTIEFIAAILVRWHRLFSDKHASLLSYLVQCKLKCMPMPHSSGYKALVCSKRVMKAMHSLTHEHPFFSYSCMICK
jgi:hypothetical protein